jgi:hypothetical protein
MVTAQIASGIDLDLIRAGELVRRRRRLGQTGTTSIQKRDKHANGKHSGYRIDVSHDRPPGRLHPMERA